MRAELRPESSVGRRHTELMGCPSVSPTGLSDDAKLPVCEFPLHHAGPIALAEQHLGDVRQVRHEEAPSPASSVPARGGAARAGQGVGEGRGASVRFVS